MDKQSALTLLQTMIDFFEAGNNETDRTAKTIIEWDFDHLAFWRTEMKRLRDSGQWTGLRAPEAEILASALREIQKHCQNTAIE